MKKTLLTLIFLCCILLLQAQIQYTNIDGMEEKAGLIRFGQETRLNLPQVGVSIDIPANMTIRIPVMEGKNVDLNIGKQTYYCWDKDYLLSTITCTFIFAMEGYEKRTLEFYVYDKEYLDQSNKGVDYHVIYSTDNLPDHVEIGKPLKTKLGKTEAYKDKHKNGRTYHYINYDRYKLMFNYDSDIDKKMEKIYEGIIKSLAKRGLDGELNTYNRRVQLGYYDSDDKIEINSDDDDDLKKSVGTTSQTTVFNYLCSGVSITIPEQYDFNINSRTIISPEPGIIEIPFYLADLYNEKMLTSFFKTSQFSVSISHLTAGYMDMNEVFDNLSRNRREHQTAHAVIDGVPVTILFNGSDYDGNVDFYFEKDTYTLYGSIYNYCEATKESIDEIFSSIRISPDKESLGSGNGVKLSSLISLQEKKEVVLDKIEIPQPDMMNTCRIEMENIGLSFSLKGNIEDYMISQDGEMIHIPDDGIIKDIKIDKNSSFSISSAVDNISLLMVLTDAVVDQEEAMKDLKRSWSGFTNMSKLRAGIVKNGETKWNVVTYKIEGGYGGSATILYNGYNISLTAFGATIEEVEKKLAYFRSFQGF